MKRLSKLSLCLAAALSVQGCVLIENSIDTTDAHVEGDTLYLSGTLNSKTFAELERVMAAHPKLRRVEIGEIDGSVDADTTLQAGLLIHKAGLDTHLTADSFIESGGVDIFCAGHTRTAEHGAHVGVHAWGYNFGSESGFGLPHDDPAHAPYLAYFETVGCPVDFYWYTMEAASADDIHVMSDAELLEQQVVTRFVTP